MQRKRHPNKHLEAAVSYGESKGWRVDLRKGHCWGRMFCPHADRSGCKISVWSTPRNPENHASTIIKIIDKCSCEGGEDDNV
jgi:hypothetical protein